MFEACLAVGETRIGDQVRAADDAAHGFELLLLVRGDVEQSVGGAECPRRARSEILVADRLGLLAGNQKIRHDPAHRRECRFEHRHVDETALGTLPVDERRRNRKRCGDAADRVGNRIADAQGCRLRAAGDAHYARHALDDLVICRQVSERAILAEAGNGAVDEARIVDAQRIEAQSKAIHHAGPEVLDDDRRAVHEPPKHLLAAHVLEVQGDRALAGILGEERNAHELPIECRICAELARKITRLRDFDLDDVGAEVRELMTAERSGENVGEVKHTDSGEGPGCTGSSHIAS